MIESTAHTASAAASRVAELAQHAAALPGQILDLVRRASSVLLAGPVPTVNPTAPPGSAKIMTILGWAGWGVFAASIAGVLVICIKMATSAHRTRMGDGGAEDAGKLFWPLLACIVGSSAGAILGAVA